MNSQSTGLNDHNNQINRCEGERPDHVQEGDVEFAILVYGQRPGITLDMYAMAVVHEYVHVMRISNAAAAEDPSDPNTPETPDSGAGVHQTPCEQPWPLNDQGQPASPRDKKADCCVYCDEFETQCYAMQLLAAHFASKNCPEAEGGDGSGTTGCLTDKNKDALCWMKDLLDDYQNACMECSQHYSPNDPARGACEHGFDPEWLAANCD